MLYKLLYFWKYICLFVCLSHLKSVCLYVCLSLTCLSVPIFQCVAVLVYLWKSNLALLKIALQRYKPSLSLFYLSIFLSLSLSVSSSTSLSLTLSLSISTFLPLSLCLSFSISPFLSFSVEGCKPNFFF